MRVREQGSSSLYCYDLCQHSVLIIYATYQRYETCLRTGAARPHILQLLGCDKV